MPVDDLIAVLDRADSLYTRRAETGAVEKSVDLLSQSDRNGRQYETQWRIARARFFLGQEASSKSEKRRQHKTGISNGRRATELASERVEGRFWLGVNLALFAESAGGVAGARAILGAKRELTRAARISEEYHGAGSLRVLGKIYHKAPWFLGGSRRRGRDYFDRALAIAPSNSVTLLYAAELALDMGESDKARSLLERIVALPEGGEWEFERRRDCDIACLRLERLRGDKAGR